MKRKGGYHFQTPIEVDIISVIDGNQPKKPFQQPAVSADMSDIRKACAHPSDRFLLTNPIA